MFKIIFEHFFFFNIHLLNIYIVVLLKIYLNGKSNIYLFSIFISWFLCTNLVLHSIISPQREVSWCFKNQVTRILILNLILINRIWFHLWLNINLEVGLMLSYLPWELEIRRFWIIYLKLSVQCFLSYLHTHNKLHFLR